MKQKNVLQNGGDRCNLCDKEAKLNLYFNTANPIKLEPNSPLISNFVNNFTTREIVFPGTTTATPTVKCNNLVKNLVEESFFQGPFCHQQIKTIYFDQSKRNQESSIYNFDKFSIPNTSKRKRHTSLSGKNLDILLASLNLNEFSLPEVHLAMGKTGPACSISPAKEEYYRKIFNQLDVDNDGRVDVKELNQAYRKMGLLQIPGQAEKFVSASDQNKDGELDVAEFVKYLHEHEMKLQLMFKKIDRDKDGKISGAEIQQALKSVGITLSNKEIKDLVNKMDKDNTSTIDLEEWVEHHLLHPSADIKDIVYYWRHAEYIDIGESLIVPDNFSADEKESGYWLKTLIAGGVAGAVSRTCTAPLDRLKVLMQVNSSKSLSIVRGFNSMLREGGVKSLWRGNGINVVKIAPETAIKFATFEHIKRLVAADPDNVTTIERFVSGSLAGCTSQTCIYPMEVIKTRLAIRKTGQYRGIFDCTQQILRNEGPKAFFKGYVPNLLGIIPYAGIDLCVYETLKNHWMAKHVNDQPSNLLVVFCGMMSSTCGQLASYPLALVRTKMQAQASQSTTAENASMMSIFRHILKTDGFFGLYRGIRPNFMKVAPAVSISYLVYERGKTYLGIQKRN